MLKATAIRMRVGQKDTDDVKEIDSIHIEGGPSPKGWEKKENLYDFLRDNPNDKIYVDIEPNPELIKAKDGEQKYVRSSPNDTENDNLLKLPRE
ncbi:hypothetical protein CHL76_14770 [Marinococcus halophilus]|uniref:DUF3892 domain-containing protein n=1 Tax=Marinococcus halophilus TaxID=1371 RepID=A0A510Y969_MARHA|nr:DUF3892 domain-containing protein [Marinococcus halophilus]OZT79079.1 hypothetical protein CHL76_14770 [Marinococcus halophilus]GEK59936.1 hypothetical protein MHA01_28410 [Marinococcus halophilus]